MRAIRKVWSWLIFLASVVYGVAVVLRAWKIPSEEFWNAHPNLVVGGVVLGSFFVFFGEGRRLVSENRLAVARRDRELLDSYCRTLALHISEGLDVKLQEVGAHIWVTKGPYRWKRLHRAASFKPSCRPESSVSWTQGKRAIGYCWSSRKEKCFDLREFAKYDRQAFDELSDDARLGLSWDEFEQTRHYKLIFVTPLKRNGEVMGVVSIDSTSDVCGSKFAKVVDEGTVRSAVATIELVLTRAYNL